MIASDNPRQWVLGTKEYLKATVSCDVELDSQPVAFTFDGGDTFHDAEWIGAAGTTRKAQLLIDEDIPLTVGRHNVYVRVTDSPEIPLIDAGTLSVRNP